MSLVEFSTDLDGFHRAQKSDVSLPFFLRGTQRSFWNASLMESFCVVYGSSPESVDDRNSGMRRMTTNLFSEIKYTYVNVEVGVYDFFVPEDVRSISRFFPFKKNVNVFEIGNRPEIFTDLVHDLFKYRETIRSRTAKLVPRVLEAPNKKVSLAFINIPSSFASLFEDKKFVETFISVLHSPRQRVFVMLLCEDGTVPLHVLQEFSWVYLMGEQSRKEMEADLNYPYGPVDIDHRMVGVLREVGKNFFYPVYRHDDVPSEWVLRKEQQLEDEDTMYRKFLESLGD